MSVIDLNANRKPVKFTVDVTANWDGSFEAFVNDVSDDERSRAAVSDILCRLSEQYLKTKVGHVADDMLAVMLANIDHAMSATDTKPAVFNVSPAELGVWVDAVQKYETARFQLGAHDVEH